MNAKEFVLLKYPHAYVAPVNIVGIHRTYKGKQIIINGVGWGANKNETA